MKNRQINRILAAALTLTLFFSLVMPVIGTEPDGETYVRIDRTYLESGGILKVENPSGLELEFFVGEEKAASDELLLNADYYENWITVKGYDGDGGVYEDRAYFSKLPVIYIDTDDGNSITSKQEYKDGNMFVQSNTETKKPEYNGRLQIKGRGNSSWAWPKKPYRIKLDKKADLFGMGSNKNWVLLSNYLDECFLRNKVAYDLSGELGLEYMESVWCDVVLNGEYVGNYLLCEQIRIDETRVNIFDWESEAKDVAKAIAKAEKKKGNILDQDALEDAMKCDLSWVTSGTVEFEGAFYATGKTYDDIAGGYIFELSIEYDELSQFKTGNGLMVMLKSPEYLYTNDAMMSYVEKLWNYVETAFRSEDGYVLTDEGEKLRYTDLVDMDSLVSYWLAMEIMGNVDGAKKSRYAYLDMDSKLVFGPAWDFDWGSGSLTVAYTPRIWKGTCVANSQAFFNDIADDPYFSAKATEKYWEIRPYLEEVFADGGTVDQYIGYLYESGVADGEVWDRNVTWNGQARGFAEDARMFKEFMQERIRWLDEQFATDKQLVKSTYTSASAYPYKAMDTNITFNVAHAREDTESLHAPADCLLDAGRDAVIDLKIMSMPTVSFDVYVNGIYYGSYGVPSGYVRHVDFVIDKSAFTEEQGKKNVINVICRDADGKATFKNFCTVIQKEGLDHLPGDANCDTKINAKDLVLIKKYIAGSVLDDGIYFANADINGDGKVNSRDIVSLKKLLVS